MATEETIKSIIKSETNNRRDVNAISADTILSDAGIDSLDMSSVFLTIEEQFNITISNKDVEKLQTITDIVQYINAAK